MAERTAISWADDTFNPWEGCQKVSPACDGCYAEARNARYAGQGGAAANWGPGAPRRRTSAANWAKPLKWEREQAARVKYANDNGLPPPAPRFVFCASLADVFDNAVPVEWRSDLFELIWATPHLTWLPLTKRPGNITALFAEAITPELRAKWSKSVGLGRSLWPRNAAIGCTVVTQEEADRDIPKLLAAKAGLHPAFAFVSMEPLLGPVDLTCVQAPRYAPEDHELDWKFDALTAGSTYSFQDSMGVWESGDGPEYQALDWVITGGETDQGQHKARPMMVAWVRSLRDQCAAAGVPFHFKQWGEFAPWSAWQTAPYEEVGEPLGPDDEPTDPDLTVWQVGKRRAGRTLDGVTHDARPQVTP